MSSRLAKSPRSLPLQDKVALAYLRLPISEVSPGSGSQSHLMGFHFFSGGALDSYRQNGGFKLNTLTLDLDAIVDFIHWSQSVSLRLRSGEKFSHSVQPCVANRDECTSLGVNHYLCADTLPSLALVYPPSVLSINLAHRDHHLTFTPFLLCVLFFPSTHLKYQGLLLRKYHTVCCVHKHTLTYLHSAGQLEHLFPNQKQTAINRAPSLLSPAGESLNQSLLMLRSTQRPLVSFVQWFGKKQLNKIKTASNDKDMAPLQTQYL